VSETPSNRTTSVLPLLRGTTGSPQPGPAPSGQFPGRTRRRAHYLAASRDDAPQTPERFLTSHEVADRLGLHVKTVLRYVRCAGLPACRLPGGDLRYAWPEVSRWLNERKEAST
jgi:excisionase family DNA binding protein